VFIPLIVTVGDRRRTAVERTQRACPACGRAGLRLAELRRQFALFFIPLWRWGRRHLLVCDGCGLVLPVESGEAAALLASAARP